jgi:type III secretory pathway component EscU
VLANENNSIKTIFGGFLLYIGFVIITEIEMPVLTLAYTILVVGVLWYWVDMLRTQYEIHRKEYQKKMRILNNEIRRWSKKKNPKSIPEFSHQRKTPVF